jgi:hypothetical protein
MAMGYKSSLLSSEENLVLLRENAFTRWMSRDLMQAAVDFLKNIGLLPLYAETNAEGLTRYLFWRAPKDWGCEVRSGRNFEQFAKFDQVNAARGRPLLTLHVNESGIYSAVWLAPHNVELALKVMAGYGIAQASRASTS